MKRLYFGAMAVLGLWACQGDPTASLRGGPSRLTVLPGVIFISEGDDRAVEVTVQDNQLNPIAAGVSAASANTAVFTVRSDTLPPTNFVKSRFFITAIAPGRAMLNVTGPGVTDEATVNVLPLAFTGAASTTTPQVGQEFTLSSTALLEFGAETDIDFGDGIYGVVTTRNATTLTVVVPQPDASQPDTLGLDNVVVNYVPGLEARLPTATAFDVQNPFGNNTAPDPTDPDATLVISPGGAPITFMDGYTSSGIDKFYTLSVTATTTFRVDLEWDTAADIDILYCDVGCANLVGNFDGATGSNPESSTVTFMAGSYNLWLNVFDVADEPAHLYTVTITPQ